MYVWFDALTNYMSAARRASPRPAAGGPSLRPLSGAAHGQVRNTIVGKEHPALPPRVFWPGLFGANARAREKRRRARSGARLGSRFNRVKDVPRSLGNFFCAGLCRGPSASGRARVLT